MIEFDGYISGAAEKHFWRKSAKMANKFILFALVVFIPVIVMISIRLKMWLVPALYGAMFVIFPLLTRIPKSENEKKKLTPYKVVIEEEYIVCQTASSSESRNLDDVKQIFDYGDFYDINFEWGKLSDKFICQKDLLTKGSLEEFERIFSGKIFKKK